MTAEALPLDRIHDLAANYSDRQGLRIVPIGVALFLESLPHPVWMPKLPPKIDAVVLTVLVGLVGYYLIGIYYRRRFGNVEELPHDGLPMAAQIGLVVLCFMVSMGIDIVVRPPVFVSGLVIAGWLIAASWSSRHIRKQYFAIAAWLAIWSVFAPLLAFEAQRDVARSYAAFFGVLLILAGVRDHIELVRAFPPMEAQHE